MPFVCVGAAHWDLIGRTRAALPPGADVPGRVLRRPGGVALNVALALAALGRPVALVAALGDDAAGDALAARLAAAGVEGGALHRRAGATDAYLAIEGPGGELHAAVADCAGLEAAGPALLAPLRAGRFSDARLVADGNLPPAVLADLLALRRPRAPALVLASPEKAGALAGLIAGRGLTLYLNRREAERLCKAGFPDARAAAEAVVARGAAEAVVTDGVAAAAAASPGAVSSLEPPAIGPIGVTGAGDAFVAAHLAARADGVGPEPALRAALAAAARHITAEVP